jgi:hypothetical protein
MILPVGRGWQEGIPSPKYSLIVASGHSPLSFASGRWSPQRSIPDNSPLIGLRRAGPTTRAIRQQATIHTASTHNGVDLASSDGRKALGMDGRPIMPHRQIQWVYIN